MDKKFIELAINLTDSIASALKQLTQIYYGESIRKEHISIFYNIYISSMERNNILISITYLEDIPISSEFVLLGAKIAYGFLWGTLKEYYSFNANTFQRWQLINFLYSKGVEIYSMGGGASRYDSIYKYKLSFSKKCNNPFFIGTYVHRPDIYQVIQNQWQEKYPLAADKYSYQLQGYRHQF